MKNDNVIVNVLLMEILIDIATLTTLEGPEIYLGIFKIGLLVVKARLDRKIDS